MITGTHAMLFSKDPDADRLFLRDVLEIPCIDSGGGWLIFKLPPAELGVHGGENGFHQVYFICDDVDAFIAAMTAKGVACDAVEAEPWGRITYVALPGGGKLGVYEAIHARP
jgi:catechol 2,3-dioxygenase-like lactoylglutathione lyase family enzyme